MAYSIRLVNTISIKQNMNCQKTFGDSFSLHNDAICTQHEFITHSVEGQQPITEDVLSECAKPRRCCV